MVLARVGHLKRRTLAHKIVLHIDDDEGSGGRNRGQARPMLLCIKFGAAVMHIGGDFRPADEIRARKSIVASRDAFIRAQKSPKRDRSEPQRSSSRGCASRPQRPRGRPWRRGRHSPARGCVPARLTVSPSHPTVLCHVSVIQSVALRITCAPLRTRVRMNSGNIRS